VEVEGKSMNSNKTTVYIIGAGASVDWKFPVGDDLKSDIAGLFELGSNYNFIDREMDLTF